MTTARQRRNELTTATSWRLLRRLAHVRRGTTLDKLLTPLEEADIDAAAKESRRPFGFVAYRVPTEKGMHWMLSCNRGPRAGDACNVRLIFLLDKSARFV